jgi:hypothetical protein
MICQVITMKRSVAFVVDKSILQESTHRIQLSGPLSRVTNVTGTRSFRDVKKKAVFGFIGSGNVRKLKNVPIMQHAIIPKVDLAVGGHP